MASEKKITASITALVTPFKNGRVDDDAFQSFVDWQINSGTSALVPCGTTGETSTLTVKEHMRVIEMCAEAAAGRVPVIAGVGSNNTATAIKLAKRAKAAGADAGLSVSPYYNKPSQEGLYQHFLQTAEKSGLPLVLYNIPGRSIVDISLETMARLAQSPLIIGLKDATSDISRISDYTAQCGEDFIQLSGDDPTALAHWAHGGSGCISVASNVAPQHCAAFHAACASGDFKSAQQWHAKLDRLFKDLFAVPSPAPAKYALSLLGRMQPDVRLPITQCTQEARIKVEAAMRHAGLTW